MACSDPFLAALVGHKEAVAERVFKADAQLRDDYSAIEAQLQAKADGTSSAFSHLLACIQVRTQCAKLAGAVLHASDTRIQRIHRTVRASWWANAFAELCRTRRPRVA